MRLTFRRARSTAISALSNLSGALVQTRTSRTERPKPRFHFGPRPSISPLVTRIAPGNSPACRLSHRLRPSTTNASAMTAIRSTPRATSSAIYLVCRLPFWRTYFSRIAVICGRRPPPGVPAAPRVEVLCSIIIQMRRDSATGLESPDPHDDPAWRRLEADGSPAELPRSNP